MFVKKCYDCMCTLSACTTWMCTIFVLYSYYLYIAAGSILYKSSSTFNSLQGNNAICLLKIALLPWRELNIVFHELSKTMYFTPCPDMHITIDIWKKTETCIQEVWPAFHLFSHRHIYNAFWDAILCLIDSSKLWITIDQ